MEEKKISSSEDVKKRIFEKLAETQSAQQGEELPKGTIIEDQLKALDEVTEIETAPVESPETVPVEEKKRGRGRPRGTYKRKKTVKEKKPDGTTQETISEEEHDTPIVEKVDFFASIVNAALLPLAGHFLNKDVNDLMITDAQSKENVKYMPEDVIIKPSWGAYIGMSLLSVASNVMMAPARNKEAEELDKAKKTLVKMMEVEKLKNEVAKMQAENDRLNNMHVIKPEREQRPWIADAEIISQTGN